MSIIVRMLVSGCERLSDDDRAILALESRTVAGHVCKLIVLEEGPGPGDRLEILRRQIASRLSRAPRLRQRLVSTPLGVAAPVWTDDPGFDIANHVLPLVAPSPVAVQDLPELVAMLMAGRLDRHRPLWSLHVVEFNEGSAALIWRIHHCMADGTAALRLGAEVLWDGEPNATERLPSTAWSPRPLPGHLELFAAGTADRLRRIARWRPPVLRPSWQGGPRQMLTAVRRELLTPDHPSPFDARRLTSERVVAFARAPLSDLKRIGRYLGDGATVNDVLLAVIAGGLRYWIGNGQDVPARLRAKVPVSLHDHDVLANHDSFFSVDLPIGEADPVTRLRLIHAETSVRKSHQDADALDALFHKGSRMPVPLERFLARRADAPRVAALSISNVPGPAGAIFVGGARVRELYSVAEIGDRHGLRVAAVSLDGVLSLGFCADPSVVPQLGRVIEGVRRELAFLHASAASRTLGDGD